MSPFRSITQKYLFLVAVTLLPTLILLGVSYRFTHHLQENVKVMEAARTQKMLIYELSWQLNMAAVGNHPSPNEHLQVVRDNLLPEIGRNIEKLGSSICSESFCYSHHEVLLRIVDERKRHWKQYMFPLLNRIFIELNGVEPINPQIFGSRHETAGEAAAAHVPSAHHVHELPAKPASSNHHAHDHTDFPGWSGDGSALDEYNHHIHSHLAQVDELIRIIDDLTRGEQEWFERIRLVFILSVFILLIIFTRWIRFSLVTPLLAVSRAVTEVAKGNYAVNLHFPSKDEIGDIAINFNHMAETITKAVVDNKKLLRDASRKQEELSLLNRVSKGISGLVSFEELLDHLVVEIRKISFFRFQERACLFLTGKEGEGMRLVASRSRGESGEPGSPDTETWAQMCKEAVRRRTVVVSGIDDVSTTDEVERGALQNESGYIALPFFAKDELLGVLCLFYEPFIGRFPVLVRELLSALTELVAISVGTILTFQHMKRIASFPEKTPNPIVEFNQELDVVYINRAARKICRELSIEPRKLLPERLYFDEGVEEEPMRAMTSWEHRVGDRVFDEYIHLFGDESIRLYAYDVTGRREMESALRESEERFRAIVESSTDWIWEVDAAGVYAYTSPRVGDLLGYCPTEMIGRSIFAFISPDEAREAEERFRSHASQRAPFSMLENCFICKDGTRIVLETSGIPIHTDGKFCGYRGISRDITDRKKAMEELQASEARFRTLLDVAPIGIIIVDLQGTIVEVNRSALHLFGYEDKEQLYARPVTGLYDKSFDFAQLVELLNSDLAAGGKDLRFRRKDGVLRWGRISVAKHLDNTGRELIIIALKDITERKNDADAMREYSQQLLALTEASHLLLQEKQAANVHHEICRIAQEIFGMKMVWLGLVAGDELKVEAVAASGDTHRYLEQVEIYLDDRPESRGPVGRAIKNLQPSVVEDVERDPDFEPWRPAALSRGYHAALAIPLIRAGEKAYGSLNFYHEQAGYFTEQRVRMLQAFVNQAHTAIDNALLLQNLEEEVRARTAEIEQANEALSVAKEMSEMANKAKSVFLANMSHELRTPLNSVIGFSDLMLNGLAGEMSESQEEYLEDIRESGVYLLKLINEILDLSKIEAGKMELEYGEMDIEDVLELSMMLIKQKAIKHDLQLDIHVAEDLETILADEKKIKQVVVNFLSNAVKFTPDHGRITVKAEKVSAAEEHIGRHLSRSEQGKIAGVSHYLEVSVTDTGCGISEEEIKKLFQPFTQVGISLSEKTEGTGLGLALSKKIIEMHQGVIWVESEVGQGSCFAFAIPYKQNISTKVSVKEQWDQLSDDESPGK